jgi:hypothetical protein
MDIMLICHLLVEHPFDADLVRLSNFGGHWLNPSAIASILMKCWCMEFMVLVRRQQKAF